MTSESIVGHPLGCCALCGSQVELRVSRASRVKNVTWRDRMAFHLRTHEVFDALRNGRPIPPRRTKPETF